jgi:monofunctional glycosyltransferase
VLEKPELSWRYHASRGHCGRRAEPETSDLRVVRNLLLVLLAALLLPYLLTPLYRAGHPVSTLMAWRWLSGAPVSRQWVDFSAISPWLPRSVVGSEDAKFCSHHGIDWDAVREVVDDAEDGEVTRGGSTITQQVAKNLFLWPGRSVIRKALEFPLALWIDLVLPKQRILEIYLNVAELGPSGQFGAQAGAAFAFGRSASSLSPREAALLAAILPNPVKRSARHPGPGVRRLAGIYVARAQASDLQHCWRESGAF